MAQQSCQIVVKTLGVCGGGGWVPTIGSIDPAVPLDSSVFWLSEQCFKVTQGGAVRRNGRL